MNEKPYNPLERKNLGGSVAKALLEREPLRMDKLNKFNGAGVYTIYYTGDFGCYQPIAHANQDGRFRLPIYVGKAIPAGARKGGIGMGEEPGAVLFKRMNEHAKTLDCAENLFIEHFFCRFLVVEDIWIPLGESLLIAKFNPIWNTLIDGFGNHDPGKGRYNQLRSRWDVLHPGRNWALKCQPREETAEQIANEVAEHLRSHASIQQLIAEDFRLFSDDGDA